jgi:hypothetical protein
MAADARGRQRSILVTWLLNPFEFVAGARALVIGLGLIVVAGLGASIARVHLDGVMDAHMAAPPLPAWVFIGEGLINWLALSLPLVVAGRALSRSRVRAIDVLGTEALARAPMLVVIGLALLPGVSTCAQELVRALQEQRESACGTAHMTSFLMFGLGAAAAVTWMIFWMYRAFAVSCNLRGGRAVAAFAVVLLAAEAASKVAIGAFLRWAS